DDGEPTTRARGYVRSRHKFEWRYQNCSARPPRPPRLPVNVISVSRGIRYSCASAEDPMMRIPALAFALSTALVATLATPSAQQPPPSSELRFEISIAPGLTSAPIDGRMLLIVSRDETREPRFQTGRGLESQPLFGVDVEEWDSAISKEFVLTQREVVDSSGNRSIIPVRTYMERAA